VLGPGDVTGADDGSAPPLGSRLFGSSVEPVLSRGRLQFMVTAAIVVANVVGAGVVTVLVGVVVPRTESLRHATIVANAIAIPLYIAGAVAVGVVWGTRSALAKVSWAIQGRRPERSEQRAALRAPLGLVVVQGVLWAVATVVFTVIALVTQPAMAVDVALTVALGGIVTCAASYLMTEFLFRPIAASALSVDPPDEPLTPGLEVRWLLAWTLGSGVPVAGLIMVAVFALVRGHTTTAKLSDAVFALGAVALGIGLLLAWLAVRAAADPIRSLRRAARSVEQGDFETEVVVYDASEIGMLQVAFNRMVAGLRERERLRDLFGRHVGEDVARRALDEGVALGGEVRDVAVLFVDIVGSTTLASTRSPEEVVSLLNRFFDEVVRVVTECGGSVNKFEGDAVLAVFGAPAGLADHAGAALRAARTIHERLAVAIPECRAGIGVACGPAVAGNVGAEHRFEYTVIGDPVNEAARLCELAKSAEPPVTVSMTTVDAATDGERGHWVATEEVTLRGRTAATRLAVPRPAPG